MENSAEDGGISINSPSRKGAKRGVKSRNSKGGRTSNQKKLKGMRAGMMGPGVESQQ